MARDKLVNNVWVNLDDPTLKEVQQIADKDDVIRMLVREAVAARHHPARDHQPATE